MPIFLLLPQNCTVEPPEPVEYLLNNRRCKSGERKQARLKSDDIFHLIDTYDNSGPHVDAQVHLKRKLYIEPDPGKSDRLSDSAVTFVFHLLDNRREE